MQYLDIFFLIGRILFGGFFVMSGLNHFMKAQMLKGYAQSKKVPMPGVMVFISGLMLLLGGLGIVLGTYVAWSVLLLVLFLVPTSFMMHNFWSDRDLQTKMANQINFMKNMALTGAALMLLMLQQPWMYSIGG